MIARVHIYAPSGKYQARVRDTGCRKYRLIGKPTRSYVVACTRMAVAFAKNRNVKRGDVLWLTDNGYYEPHTVCELVRRD